MAGLRKAGGISALLQTACWVTVLLLYLVVLPSQGFAGPDDLNNPARVLPFMTSSPLITFANGIDVPFAVFILLTVLAIHRRWSAGSPDLMRVATTAGLLASALTLLSGMTGVIALPEIAQRFGTDPASAGPAFIAVRALLDALLFATPFAYGGWALLASLAGRRSGQASWPFAFLGLVFGATGLLAFLIQPLGLIGPVLGIIWTSWLGIALLHERSEVVEAPANARAVAPQPS